MIRQALVLFSLMNILMTSAQVTTKRGPDALYPGDWLVHSVKQKAGVYTSVDNKDIILFNGLLKREFRLAPNVVCTDYQNMITGQQLLRALTAEAVIVITGKEWNVGGLYGQKEKA